MTKIELKYLNEVSIVSENEISETLNTYPTEKERLNLFIKEKQDLVRRGIKDGVISAEFIQSL